MGNPIRKFRSDQSMSLAAFGELVGVKKAAVYKWERDRPPSPASARKIEEVTNGAITKEQLRPDLWSESEQSA